MSHRELSSARLIQVSPVVISNSQDSSDFEVLSMGDVEDSNDGGGHQEPEAARRQKLQFGEVTVYFDTNGNSLSIATQSCFLIGLFPCLGVLGCCSILGTRVHTNLAQCWMQMTQMGPDNNNYEECCF